MIFKKNKKPLILPYDFKAVMKRTQDMLSHLDDTDSKSALLDYLIQALILDLISSSFTEIMRNDYPNGAEWITGIFPFPYWSAPISDEKITVELKDANVLVLPYDTYKLSRAAKHIREKGFRSDLNWFDCTFFPEINLLYVFNGIHHSAIAALKKQGSIIANVIHMYDLLSYYTCDGRTWQSVKYDKQYPVNDVRGALIFELFRIREQLLKRSEEDKNRPK